jgi:DNA-binding PadR family transcriptional regulator
VEINKDLIAASSTPVVLAILAEADSYGYAILQRVRELSGGRMEWTDGMLYPVLHRLERLGHIEARWEVAESGRRRKYYAITPQGHTPARRGATAVGGGRRHAPGHLACARPTHQSEATGSLTIAASEPAVVLEEQIDQWRGFLRRRQAIHPVDVAELEDHLREQVAILTDAGLAADEAFLVAVKRMGDLDALSREFAREHSDRLWKQLVVSSPETAESKTAARKDAIVAFSLAVVAALAIKVPALFGKDFDEDAEFYARNFSLFVLPPLTAYFVWKRALRAPTVVGLASRSSQRPCSRTSTHSIRTAPPRC